MGCSILKSRGKQCKDTLGGLELIYIFPYVKYAKSLIKRNELVLTTYPYTLVRSFEIVSGDYSESATIEDGGDFIDQSLSATMTGLNQDNEWRKLLKKEHGVIAKDRNGKFRLLGVYNGLETDYKATTGGGHSDFNGWTFNFKGKEQDQALYFDNLFNVGFLENEDLYNYIARVEADGGVIESPSCVVDSGLV